MHPALGSALGYKAKELRVTPDLVGLKTNTSDGDEWPKENKRWPYRRRLGGQKALWIR